MTDPSHAALAVRPSPSLQLRQAVRSPGLTPTSVVRLQSSKWLMWFVYFEIFCQIALLFPSVAALRVVVRSAAFAMSPSAV